MLTGVEQARITSFWFISIQQVFLSRYYHDVVIMGLPVQIKMFIYGDTDKQKFKKCPLWPNSTLTCVATTAILPGKDIVFSREELSIL